MFKNSKEVVRWTAEATADADMGVRGLLLWGLHTWLIDHLCSPYYSVLQLAVCKSDILSGLQLQ